MASSKSRRNNRKNSNIDLVPVVEQLKNLVKTTNSPPVRLLVADILGKKTDITNASLSQPAIDLLKKIVEDSGIQRGETFSLDNYDIFNAYGAEEDATLTSSTKSQKGLAQRVGSFSPADELKFSLGRLNLFVDDEGIVRSDDAYNFNSFVDFAATPDKDGKYPTYSTEEFEEAGFSTFDVLSSLANSPELYKAVRNIGFLLGSRGSEKTPKAGRQVKLDLGRIEGGSSTSPLVSKRPKSRAESKKEKQEAQKLTPADSPSQKDVLKYLDEFKDRELAPKESIRPQARPRNETAELFGDVSQYLDNLSEENPKDTAPSPSSSLRPKARPKDETVELFGEVSEYLNKLPERKLSLESSVRPQARPTRTVETPAAEPASVDTDSMSFGDAFKYYTNNTDQDVFEWRGKKYKAERKFAEGGLAMDNQMKKMYNEGGFADDGATVEPVTGNRVPPGSLDQEVRDNVDAKLSEGEYVIPADVVRYLGLGQIERMVQKAKRGLEDMDANGRIGGEPVDSEGVPIEEDEELTPEEMQMLSEALGETAGMATGGMVQPQAQGVASQFSPQTVGNQFSQPQSTTGGETPFGNLEIVEYINTDTGQTMMVTLLNGNPLGPIPEGFVRSSEQAMKKPEAPTEINPEVDKGQDYERDTGDSEQRRREIEEDKKNSNTWAEENYEAILDDPVGYVKEQLEVSRLDEGIQKYGARVGALINPVLGGVGAAVAAANALGPLAKARGTRDFMKELGMDTSEVDSLILDYEDSLPGGVDAAGDIFATGKNRKASLLEIHQARSGSSPTTSLPKATPTSKAIPTSGGSDGERDSAISRANELSGGSNAKVSTDSMGVTRAISEGSSGSASVTVGSAAPKTTTSRPQSRPSKSPASSATDSRGRTSEDKDFGKEGFNKGGLVAKPSNYKSKATKKKQKSRRGLGSK